MSCPGSHGRRPLVLHADARRRLTCLRHGDAFAALAQRVSPAYRHHVERCAEAAVTAELPEDGDAWYQLAATLTHLDRARLQLERRVHALEMHAPASGCAKAIDIPSELGQP